ncbi:MAG: thioesterase family protein [Gammaproteobacteria bacterium]|nr:thioesterase family protein [Gammaproteobacteria bacterium]MBU2058319.1 thioesterase family protein [Gammaproteobacteria bacterium]MBU2176628.1 thioesterase family protein [Gammaproteobacteria bacterium]MBU2248430.1 thioesterase family protein [Gammaproteobacteria bacterium]MBU2345707.1 thioesterase family protein [Gammaproteobacteria bacterium]
MLFADVLQQFKAGQPDELQIEVPEQWGQGRAVFGGMASALALAHLVTELPAQIPLRSVSVSFVAPLNAGPATVSRRILRQGKSVIQTMVEITQQGQVALVLLASFGVERPSAYKIASETAPAFAEKALVMPKQGPVPEFTRHFDYQIKRGVMPFSGGSSTELGGLIRFAEGHGTSAGVLELLALVDAWPPVSLTLLNQPAPASSLTWTIEFIQPHQGAETKALTTDWWSYLASIEHGADGYHHIEARLWQPDGQLAAISRQTVTVFA